MYAGACVSCRQYADTLWYNFVYLFVLDNENQMTYHNIT